MKTLLVLTVTLATLTGCGKKSQEKSSSPEVDTPAVETPLPENSSGVMMNVDEAMGLMSVSIPARKKYGPALWEDGWFYLPRTAQYYFPATLPVTGGRPGNHLAYIILEQPAGVDLKCIYLGKSNNTAVEYNSAATPYHFDFCVEASVAVTPGTRASVKASLDNIIDTGERATTPINMLRGDKVTVNINNGNTKGPGGNTTTEVLGSFKFNF